MHTLADYAGTWVLLYFYPKDDTPGCTKEACGIRDAFAELSTRAQVLGVSADSVESHQKFAEKYQLPFSLLADPDRAIIAAYGADGVLLPKRVSFLIDDEGNIAKVYQNVNVEEHAQQILTDLMDLQEHQVTKDE